MADPIAIFFIYLFSLIYSTILTYFSRCSKKINYASGVYSLLAFSVCTCLRNFNTNTMWLKFFTLVKLCAYGSKRMYTTIDKWVRNVWTCIYADMQNEMQFQLQR